MSGPAEDHRDPAYVTSRPGDPGAPSAPGPIEERGTGVPGATRGLAALESDDFSLLASIGGLRGLVESVLPGLVFVTVFLVTDELRPTLIAALAVAVIAVLARLVQRTPVVQAFSGFVGVAIGIYWAWVSGDPKDYYLYGLLTNAAYLVAGLISIVAGWPLVGVAIQLLRTGLTAGRGAPARPAPEAAPAGTAAGETALGVPDEEPSSAGESLRSIFAGWSDWRRDPALRRRYTVATWVWVAMFGVRLAVQVPLFLGSSVAWLGTARLAMGVPLWALTLWITWVLVRAPGASAERSGHSPAR